MRTMLLSVFAGLLAMPLTAQDLSGVKCIVDPEAAAQVASAVDYSGGQVYFCCPACAAKFEENPDKWASMARYQLVVTGQFRQTACPLSGNDLAKGMAVDIGDLTVGVCCNQCKTNLDEAAGFDQKVAVAFSAKSFENGFQVARPQIDLADIKCFVMDDADVSADSFVEFNGGKVFFCCDRCRTGFDQDNPDHVAAANRQLAQSGQFLQSACPFSGRPVIDDALTKIGNLEIGFCNTGCRDKVKNAGDDATRTRMVFANEAFARGFEPVKD